MNKLVITLKDFAPVRTGNLRDNGIQGVANIVPGKLWLVQIGYPATPGYVATDKYALKTHTTNRSSKGWVTNAINYWLQENKDEINDFIEKGVEGIDNDL